MAIVPALLAAALYFLPRVRRDKQGRLYIHSNIYEQKKHNKKLGAMIDRIQDTETSVLKLRILSKSNPPQEAAYHRYKMENGNGYIDHSYKEY
jgi:carbonic anhydrase